LEAYFAHIERQGKLIKQALKKPVINKIRSKCILHYLPRIKVATDDAKHLSSKYVSKNIQKEHTVTSNHH
jgi:hypothetical protein